MTRTTSRLSLATLVGLVAILVTFLMIWLGPSVAAQNSFWPPDIDEVSPEEGPPGTIVNVTGRDFEAITGVTFGEHPVAFEQVDDETIRFTVPDLVAYEYEIVVENENGDDDFCCFDLTQPAPTTSSAPSPTPTPTTTAPAPTPTLTQAPDGCATPGMNMQCSEYGRLGMPAHHTINGAPVEVTAQLQLATNFGDRGAQWLMVSLRHVDEGGSSPVMVEVTGFSADGERVFVTKEDRTKPNELNLWIDRKDVRQNEPMDIRVRVGATSEGVYQLETLAMPFGRDYTTLKDATGQPVSLYSFTTLAVNKPTTAHSIQGANVGAPSLVWYGLAIVLSVAIVSIMAGKVRRR